MAIGILGLLAAAEGGTEFSIFGSMLREWYLMAPLVLASIAVVIIGVERFLFVRKASEQAKLLFDQVLQMANAGGAPSEIAAAAEQAFSGSMYKALFGGPFQQQVTAAAMERCRASDIAACKRGFWFVGTMGNLAPFFGLFGTVIGIIQSFISIARTGGGGFATVSSGIATALVTTAAGILVGILAVFIYNYLNVMVAQIASDLRNYGEELYELRLVKLAQARAASQPGRRATDVPAREGAAG